MKLNDILKGLAVSVVATSIMTLLTLVQNDTVRFDQFKTAAAAGIAAGMAYLAKNLLAGPAAVPDGPFQETEHGKKLTRYDMLKRNSA